MAEKEYRSDEYNSDDEIVEKDHEKLLRSLSKLDKSQHVKKPTRTEPSLQVSEFNLVKTQSKKPSVNLKDLAKAIRKKPKLARGVKLPGEKKSKPLDKPLEKPTAEQLAREADFQTVIENLDRWESIVQANRAAEHLSFPLKKIGDLKIKDTSTEYITKFMFQSEMEKALDEIQPALQLLSEETEFALTIEELVKKRNEAARIRVQQSYREAKARRLNRIKSKVFHRMQRKENIKQVVRDLQSQQIDPETLMNRLDEIEKSRVKERATLRHRSIGRWAKKKVLLAKYDKESRLQIAQQLGLSRDLTQKFLALGSSDSEPEDDSVPLSTDNADNPWVNCVKSRNEVKDFVSDYQKHQEKETGGPLKEGYDQELDSDVEDIKATMSDICGIYSKVTDDSRPKVEKPRRSKPLRRKKIVYCGAPVVPKPRKTQPQTKDSSVGTGPWVVTAMETSDSEESVDLDSYDVVKPEQGSQFPTVADEKLKAKPMRVKKGVCKCKKPDAVNVKLHIEKKNASENVQAGSNYTLRDNNARPDIDEALHETADNTEDHTNADLEDLAKLVRAQTKSISTDIDPTDFIEAKKNVKELNSSIPDLMTTGEEAIDDLDPADIKHLTISEAFEDDDVVDEFQKEKEEDTDKNTPNEPTPGLPGWGSWSRVSFMIPIEKKKRFVTRVASRMTRNKANQGDVIVNDRKDTKIQSHQVSQVPFPFKNVTDFQTSTRFSLGNQFVPEEAHKKLVKPKVVTKQGQIIEPMDEDVLVDNSKAKGSL